MIKNNFYSISGALVFIIPFLGIPNSVRNYIISALGLVILFYSIWPIISERLTAKPKMRPKIVKIKVPPNLPTIE